MKYFLIFIFFLNIILSKNLSAYYEVSIKNFDNTLTKEYFLNKILKNLSNYDLNPNKLEDYITNFFYDRLKQEYNFQVNIKELSEKLISDNYNFNLNVLNCSLRDDFFKFESSLPDHCPKFKLITFEKQKYIYISNLNTSLRIKKVSDTEKIFLNEIWINFLPVNRITNRNLTLDYKQYIKLTDLIYYYPIINSYNDGDINISIDHYYNNKEINFLLNFL